MDSDQEPPVFPYHLIWEEFGPTQPIDWKYLELNRDEYESLFSLADCASGYFTERPRPHGFRFRAMELGQLRAGPAPPALPDERSPSGTLKICRTGCR